MNKATNHLNEAIKDNNRLHNKYKLLLIELNELELQEKHKDALKQEGSHIRNSNSSSTDTNWKYKYKAV